MKLLLLTVLARVAAANIITVTEYTDSTCTTPGGTDGPGTGMTYTFDDIAFGLGDCSAISVVGVGKLSGFYKCDSDGNLFQAYYMSPDCQEPMMGKTTFWHGEGVKFVNGVCAETQNGEGQQEWWMMSSAPTFTKLSCMEAAPEEELTCGTVKASYRTNDCCGNPSKKFVMDSNRRLHAESNTAYLKTQIAKALEDAKAAGGTHAAQGLARKIRAVLTEHVA